MAHLLTSVRLLLALPVGIAIARPGLATGATLFAGLSLAVLTDYWDGIIARRTGTASPGGQLFDHSTDCLFVTSGLTGAAIAGLTPAALPLLIVVAFSQYVVDSYWFFQRKQLLMNAIGRWNGILYFVPIFFIAGARLTALSTVSATLIGLGKTMSYLLIASTVISIADRATAARAVREHPRPNEPT